MSDYMFMLESHLNADHNRVVNAVTAIANDANVNLYLAGGAVRDMLGGFVIRDLDFTLESNVPHFARKVAEKLGGTIRLEDPYHRFTELTLPGGVTAQIAVAREESYAKPGGKPRIIAPVPIWADLKRRDFTVDGIALGLNRGSRGQLRDPNNGIADLQNRELRASYLGIFTDDPVRMLRMIRLKHRLGFVVDERTARQFENARLEELHELIPADARLEELKAISQEPTAAEILKDYQTTGLMPLFSPALAGSKLDLHGLEKLEKLRKQIPQSLLTPSAGWLAFLNVLTAPLNARDKGDLARKIGLDRRSAEAAKKLPADARKLESTLKSARMQKPSHVYFALEPASGDVLLYVMYHSQQRIVQDRIRNYLQKYLPAAEEAAVDMPAGKARVEAITKKLNARPKKPPVVVAEVQPVNPRDAARVLAGARYSKRE
jgi:tRNA nucleotidyltransferase (CCA-adding enzyme)